MKPVIIVITIVSSTYVQKTVVSTKIGTDTFIKGKDELPNWLIASASQCDNLDAGTVQSMTREWEDGLSCMFPFEPGSIQKANFKNSKREMHLKNMEKFSNAPALDLVTIMSSSSLALTSMSLSLEIMLNHVSAGFIKSIKKDLLKFIMHYKE